MRTWLRSERRWAGQAELREGQLYVLSGIVPGRPPGGADAQLQAAGLLHLGNSRGTAWRPAPPAVAQQWRWAFQARGLGVAQVGRLPAGADFDAAALVLHVGWPRDTGSGRMSQWLFLADESVTEEERGGAPLPRAVLLAGATRMSPPSSFRVLGF